jgi:hypothetical protein
MNFTDLATGKPSFSDDGAHRNRTLKKPDRGFSTPLISTKKCPEHEVVLSCIWENGLPKLRFTFRYADLDVATWRQHFASGIFRMEKPFHVPASFLRSVGLKNYLILPGGYPITADAEHLHVTF